MTLSSPTTRATARWLPASEFDRLLDALRDDGRTIIGPTLRNDAIVLDEVVTADDLPAGWGAEASPGRYRTVRRDDARRFDHAVGPMSWKRWTFPPRVPSRIGKRTQAGVRFAAVEPKPTQLAFVGVRACEIAALRIQDRVFLDGPAVDADYRARRASAFVVAVECATPTSTCFCTSMETGPEVTDRASMSRSPSSTPDSSCAPGLRQELPSSTHSTCPWQPSRPLRRRPRWSPGPAGRWACPRT